MHTHNWQPTRRELFKLSTAGILGVSASGWLDRLAAHAAEQATGNNKKCILVWLDGGPSHHDTFDMKPEAPDNIRGEFQPVQTAVPGLLISEPLSRLAPFMNRAAVIRSMSTGEGEHSRARIYMHTGYRVGSGGLRYPTMGSIVSSEREASAIGMPNFVVTGMHLNPANHSYVSSPGYLGPRHQPLIVADQDRGVENLRSSLAESDTANRLSLLDDLAAGFLRTHPSDAATAQRTAYQRATQLMRSAGARAFDLSLEAANVRERYGNHSFGKGCLLARRLIETGVPFVEVYHSPTPGGWDTHSTQRANEVKTLAMPQLNQALPTLLGDLQDRGLLDETLVICMGEFGRTPTVKPGGGRDHYPRAWTTVLFGGGVGRGQIIGRTDARGATVEDRPVSGIDFMATICAILGINTEKTNYVGPRPVRVVDRGANPIRELMG